MSTLNQFAGGGVKQIITAFVKDLAPTNAASPGGASSEDFYYRDITLGSPVNISKCVVMFDGASHYTGYPPYINNNTSTGVAVNTRTVTARLTSTTNLRLSTTYDPSAASISTYYYFTGRYTIIEYF